MPSTQVGCRIDYLALVSVWVPAREIFEVWRRCAAAVASIAVVHSVDEIAPQSHQRPVFSGQIQPDWRYLKTNSNLGFLIVIVSVDAGGPYPHSPHHDHTQCCDSSGRFDKLL
jgi:hypothetical protein